MAYDIELDNKPGSLLTVGVSTNRFDRALVRGRIKADANELANAEGLNTAITEAIQFLGSEFHPQLTTLPLARVTARRSGPNYIWIFLEYFRRFVNVGSQPGALIARFGGSTRGVDWYRLPFDDNGDPQYDAFGMPDGPLLFFNPTVGTPTTCDPASLPRSWVWQQPMITIHVPFDLDFNPIGNVAGLLGTTNLQDIDFGGNTFLQNRLLFTDVSVDWYEDINGDPRFEGAYNFVAVRGGFRRQFPRWIGNSTPDHCWGTKTFPEYQMTDGWDLAFLS